jgi:hypothetical protein
MFGGKKLFEICMLALWIAIAGMLFFNINKKNQLFVNGDVIVKNGSEYISETYPVHKITVLDSNTFDLVLRNKQENFRILAKLPVKVTAEAKNKIINLLNQINKPEVHILKKDEEGYYLIELHFIQGSNKTNLKDWLQQNNFLYE